MKKHYLTFLLIISLIAKSFSIVPPPQPQDDTANTPVNTSINQGAPGVLANDTDPDGDSLQVISYNINGNNYPAGYPVNISGVGTFVLNADGSYTFNPAAGYTGTIPVITYTVNDGTSSATATLTITVGNNNNNPPDAQDDNVVIFENTTANENAPGLLGNDSDPDGDPLNIVSFVINGNTYPAGTTVHLAEGDLTINADGSYTFVPANGYTGNLPVITYTVSDGQDTDDAHLYITVRANTPPSANNDSYTTLVDTTINENAPGLLGNDSDADGDPLTITSITVGGNTYAPGTTIVLPEGNLTINADGSFTFVPAPGYTGNVPTVTYTVSDGAEVDTANLYITVRDNTPPNLQDDDAVTPQGTTLNSGTPGVLGNDSDPDGDPLTVVSFTVNGNTYAPGTTVHLAEGDLTLNADGSYTFVPASGFVGFVPTVTYTASDGFTTGTADLNITVDYVNTDPEIYISSCNQGYTASGYYKIYYDVYVFNRSYAYGAQNLQIKNDLASIFGYGCIANIDRLWLDSGNTLQNSTDPAMYDSSSWDTNEYSETDPTPGREGIFNAAAVSNNILYPRQYITFGVCLLIDPNCAGGAGVGSGNGVTFDNVFQLTSSIGDSTEHLSISDFHTSQTTVAGGIHVPVDTPPINPDGTYDFDIVVTLTNDGSATANNVQFFLPLYEFTANGIPINSQVITQTGGPGIATNPTYDGGDNTGTNTGILAANQSLPAGATVSFNIHYNVGPTSYNGYLGFYAPNPSMTQGNADVILPGGGGQENPAQQSYVIWSDNQGDHLDRYYVLDNLTDIPSSEWQCTCDTNGITLDYNIQLDVDKKIISDVPAASNLRGNREITFEITITNRNSSNVQLENPVLKDDLSAICDASHIVGITSAPVVTGSTATTVPNINTSYDGLSDTDIFDNSSGILQPGESVTVQFTVEFDDPCFGINTAVFSGNDPSGNSPSTRRSYAEVLVFPDFDNDHLPDNVDIDDDNDGILDVDEACSGLKGEYYGTNYWVWNVFSALRRVYNNTPKATFIATHTNFNSGNGRLGYWNHLQSFLGSDASSLDNDPPNNRRGIIRLTGYVYLQAGNHNFRVRADDGFRIKVNGNIVAIRNHNGGAVTYTFPSFNIPQTGYYPIEIVYWDAGGHYELTVEERRLGDPYHYLDETNTLRDCDMDNDSHTNNVDLDTDNDGLTDIFEAGGTDNDQDGQVDYPTPGNPISMTDADHDGLADAYDLNQGGTPIPNPDSDGDGHHDFRDIDSDDDGIVDYIEAQTTFGPIYLSGTDADQDGLDDAYDTDDLLQLGIGGLSGTYIIPINTDGIDNPDYLDDNSDDDADSDYLEGWDTDNDHTPDTNPSGIDNDEDGLDDAFDTNPSLADPTNGNQTAYNFPDLDTPGGDRDWREQAAKLEVLKDDGYPYTPQNLIVGDVITYQIIVNNTGTVPLDNITVTDANANIISGNPIATIAPYDSVTLLATYTVTQADIDAGQIQNSATATTTYEGETVTDISDDTDSSSPNGDDDPTITFIAQQPEISITKDDQMPYLPQNITLGQTITYQIVVQNTGNVTVHNIVVTDANAQIQGNSVISTLAPNDTAVLTATHVVTQAEIDAGYISNQAVGTFTYDGNVYDDYSDDLDPSSPSGDDDPTITNISQNPSLEVTKNDQLPYTPQNMTVGDVITYEILVTNTGNVTLNLVNVTDNNAVFISGNPITNLAPGATARVITQHTITQADLDAGQVSNSATASTDFNGSTYSDTSDDTDSASPGGDDDPTITHLIQNPEIEVTKDDNFNLLPQNINVGDVIQYNIVVTNTGNVTLYNISVSDNNATFTNGNTIAQLDVGQSATITAEHTVTYADIDAGQVINSATGTVNFGSQIITDISDDADPAGPNGNDDPTITLISQVPELTVTKDDGFPYAPQNLVVGDVITYTITVTNTGNVTLNNINVTDANATIVSGNPIATLSQGASATVIATYTVTQNDLNNGQISNTAIASVGYNGNTIQDLSDDTDAAAGPGDDDPTITLIGQNPELTVTKDDNLPFSPQNLSVGDVITYNITVTNTGNVALHSIVITDTNANIQGSNTIALLDVGQSVNLTATHTVTQAEIDNGQVVNQATASVVYNGVSISDLSDDTDLASLPGDDDPTITKIVRNPGVEVTKDDQLAYTPQTLNVGDVITYHIFVKNTGNMTLGNITVSDVNASIVSGNPILNLAPGATAMVVAQHTITQTDLDAGQVSNSAIASTDFNGQTYSDTSDDLDPNAPPGDDDPTITFLVQSPGFVVTKDDQLAYIPQNLAVGDDITYNIYVTNTGNVTLNNIILNDSNANFTGSNVIATLAVGQTEVVQATHTVTLSDINAGQVSNSATGTVTYHNVDYTDVSDDTDPNAPANDDDPTITFISQQPEITLTKDDQLDYNPHNLAPGDVIAYTITVTNTGNVTLTNIDVTDANATITSGLPILSLDPGQSATVTATHTVTQAEINSGQVNNSATGSTNYNGNNITDLSDDTDPQSPGGDDDPTITYIGQNASLEVTKDDQLAYTPQNLAVGDVITYLISVKNVGNISLHNIHVNDNNANIQGSNLIAALNPGQSTTLTATHTVSQAEVDAGEVVNTAIATVTIGGVQYTDLSDDTDVSSPSGDNDPTITHIRQTPVLTVTKDDHLPLNTPQALSVGDIINYTIDVTNNGNVTLPVVNMVDNNAVITGGTPIQNLPPGATASLTATHTVTQADINAGQISNSAVASAPFNGLTFTDTSDDTDPDSLSGDNDPTITKIIQTPGIEILKDDQLAYLPQNLAVGDVITYNITVTNTGNVDLHNIILNDDNASIQGINMIPNLSVGQTASLTATHTVTLADINAGQVSNSVTGSSNFNGQAVTDVSDDADVNAPNGNDDPTITFITQTPSLMVLKNDNYDYTPQDLHVGDVIAYQISVINTGNVTLNNITVTDANANIVSGTPIASLDPGSAANIIANHTVTQADIDAGQIANSAIATTTFNGTNVSDISDDTDSQSPTGNDDPTITFITQNPSITLTKDDGMDYSEQHLSVGDVITYTIVVQNTGNVTLDNIIVTDANANIQGTGVIASLAPNEIATLTATHTITQDEMNAGIINNSATGQVNYNTTVVSDISDDTDLSSPSGDDDPTITHLYRYAGVEVTKDDQLPYSAQSLHVGDAITYHINVTNTGNVTLNLLTVSDNNANITNGNPITDLQPGATAIVTAQHTVTQADIDAGEIQNQATVETSFNGVNYSDLSDDTDVDSPNGVDDPTITHIIQTPQYVITKDDNLPYFPQNIQVGDVINYLINVTNTGNVTLHNIDISDNNANIIGSHIITDLDVNQTQSLNATHVVTQADIDAGTISNSATGTTSFNGNDVTDVSDDADTNAPPNDDDPTLTFIDRHPELTLTKDDNLPYIPQNLGVGDVIVYNISLTNSGNVTLTDIDVTDANAVIASGSHIIQMDPGQTINISATHTITQADIDAGMVSNSATAQCTFNGNTVIDLSDDTDVGAPSGPDDPTITQLIQNPELTVTKDDQLAYTNQNLQVGDVIHYNINVTNTGNVTLQNVVVSDNNANITGNSLITSLAPNETVTVTAEHTITQADIDAGEVINQATATTLYNGNTITDLSDDIDSGAPLGDDDPTITHIMQTPSIVITKDDQLPYTVQNMAVGDVIQYQIVVTNTGNVTFSLANVTDNNANIISGNPINNLTPGNSATIIANHTITQNDLDLGRVVNSAQVTAEFNNQTYIDISDDTDPDSPPGNDDATITYLAQNPVLVLTKDDQLSYTGQNLAVGDEIHYNIYVTNNGNVTLTNIVISDTNAGINGSNAIGILPVGQTQTIQATHTITQADIDAGLVENSATGTCVFNNVTISDISDDTDPFAPGGLDDPTITHINQNSTIVVTKDDQLPYSPQNLHVGDVITYNIDVTNTGNVTLNNINVGDTNASIVAGNPIGTLLPGYTETVIATHTVTQADIDTGYIVNSAVAATTFNGNAVNDTSDDTDPLSPSGDSDPTKTTIAQIPGITVMKDDQLDYSAQPLAVGDVINYQIIVTNTGNVTIQNINVQDTNAQITGSNIIPIMAPNETVTISATHVVTQADIDAGEVINSATASLTYNGNTVSDVSDDTDLSSPSGADDPTITHIIQSPGVTVTKDDQLPYTAQNLNVGDVITYNITVQNTGNVILNLINVSDDNATIISGNPITDLYPGNSAVVIAQHVVSQADIDAGQIVNQAIASTTFNGLTYLELSDDTDPDAPAGAHDPTITHIAQNPAITVTKDDQLDYGVQNLAVGDVINYNIFVTNDGNVTLSNILVTDDNATIAGNTGSIPSLGVGQTETIHATHTVTQADLDAGFISNSAVATCNFNNNDITDISDDTDPFAPAGPDDPTITHLIQNPELTVTKDDQLSYDAQPLGVGNVITYNIVVTNSGNITLTNINVTDNNANIVSGNPINVLAPGQSETVVATHTITQADIDAGLVSNSAIAISDFNGNNITDTSDDTDPLSPTGNDDPTITHIIQNAEITVFKDDQLDYTDQSLSVGDVINYQIIVRNTGNVTLQNINIQDANAQISGSSIISSLDPNQAVTINATHTVTQADINAGEIINQASASLQFNGQPVTDLSDDLDLSSPNGPDDPTITHILQTPELLVTKDDQLPYSAQDLNVGDIITYRILVKNTGNVILDLVTVTDNNANIISGNPISNLYPGNTAIVIAEHIVTQADIDTGQISNQATATSSFNGTSFSELSDDTDINAPNGDHDATITTIAQYPSIVLTKDDQLPYTDQNLQVGDVISYNIVVTNNGNVSLTHIEVTDSNAQIQGNNVVPSLLPGESQTIIATHTVTQLDIDTGEIINQADGLTSFNNADITDLSDDTDVNSPAGDDDPTITHLVRTPILTVLKDDQLDYTDQNLVVGDVIHYQITVTNDGNITLQDIQISDANANIISGNPILVLNPGESANVLAEHTVTQADIDAGQISNSATAQTDIGNGIIVSDISDDTDTNAPLGPDDPTITHIVRTPELTVTKDDHLDYAPQDLAVGDVINYQIIVTNTGNVTLYNITVNDNNANFNGSSTITQLDPGQFATLDATHIVTQADIDAGSLSNTATARAFFNGLPITDLSDDTGNTGPDNGDDDPTITLIRQLPDIKLTKDDHLPYVPQNMVVGDVIYYEIAVTNTGNVTFNVANVQDVNANITNGNPVTNLAPGATAIVLAQHSVTQADLDAGFYENSAEVTADFNGVTYHDISDDTDPDSPIGPDDPTKTFFVQSPEITILKDDNLPYVAQNLFVGDQINYTITVTNTGNVTLTDNINLTDDNATLSNSIINGLTVGESATINATHIVTQADIDAGVVSNTVHGETSFGHIDVIDDSDDTDALSPPGDNDPTHTFISQTVAFKITKDDNLPYDEQVLNVGDIINYDMDVTNNGNVTLTNILVTDDNAIILSGNPIPTLAPGATAHVTAMHTITQADIDAGEVINQATASTNFLGTVYEDLSDDTDPLSPVGNDDPTITHIKKFSGLSLTKVGYISTTNIICPKPGESIIYTFEVRNTGNQNISNISINDPQITTPITYVSGDIDGDGKLGQNEIWIFNGSYPLDQNMIDLGYFDNQAVVHGIDPQNISISDISDDPTDPTDNDLNNDGDPDDVTHTIIPQHADLILLKKGHFNDENGNGLADEGETITYKFTVKNRCNVTIKDISIEDPLIDINPAHITLGADQVDDHTFSGTYMITLADIERGYVKNSATASGYDPNNNLVTDISDDPTNFADVDVENDNEPDDPTIVRTPNIHVYDVFTPNGDGLNDHFYILGIESFPNAVVKIYSRWGNLVYQSTGYNNTDNYWDGSEQGNKTHKLPVGVYYYVIDLGIPDVENIFTGSIYLNR